MRETVNLTKQTMRKPNGKKYTYWVLRWYGTDGKQHGKHIGRTGKVSKRQAEKKRREKEMELFKRPGRRNISRAGTLEQFLQGYFDSRKHELAESTIELHRQTAKYLLGFFGPSRRLDSIQRPDARAFKTALADGKLMHVNIRKKSLQASSVNLNVRNAQTIFGRALDDDLIVFNPFARIAGSPPPPKDWHHVSLEEFAKLFTAATPKWRLLLALARLGSLRRDEALNFRWDNVDWEGLKLIVISKETWTVKDKDVRVIPLVPELHDILLEAFQAADEGQETVIPRGSINKKNISRDFTVLCRRAGIKRYGKPLHSLRKSQLTDWAGRHPAHVVKEWAGHSSIETTDKFYLKVSEADYEAAAKEPNEFLHNFLHDSAILGQPKETPESEDPGVSTTYDEAGERIRTADVQLGKLETGKYKVSSGRHLLLGLSGLTFCFHTGSQTVSRLFPDWFVQDSLQDFYATSFPLARAA